MLAQLLLQLLMMVVTALCGWLGGRIRGAANEREERARQTSVERDLYRKTMRALLRFCLTDLHRRYVVEGRPCTAADKQWAQEIYELYHALGGNGSGTRMYEEIMACPVA